MKSDISFLTSIFVLFLPLIILNCIPKDNTQNINSSKNIINQAAITKGIFIPPNRGANSSSHSSHAYDKKNTENVAIIHYLDEDKFADEFDLSVFEDFRLGNSINSLNEISDLNLHVDLRETSKDSNRWAGKVAISYFDAERPNPDSARVITFNSGKGKHARYNIWKKWTNIPQKIFHGFFQEKDGALIIIIDKLSTTPDATNTECKISSGTIWTMQFRTTFGSKKSCNNKDNPYIQEYNNQTGIISIPSLSERNKKCWDISKGPYDCRTDFKLSSDNQDNLQPNSGCYKKLGRFVNLNLCKAFNVTNTRFLNLVK